MARGSDGHHFLVFYPGPRRADEPGARRLTNDELDLLVEALEFTKFTKSPKKAVQMEKLASMLKGDG